MTMVNGKVEYCASGKSNFCPTKSQEEVPTQEKVATLFETPITVPPTTQVKYNCDSRAGLPIHLSEQDIILTNIGWATKTEAQINDFKDALNASISVNGVQIHSSIDFGDTQEKNGMFIVQAMFDVGELNPGEYEIQTNLTFDKNIYDGNEWYGPETQYLTIEGTCTVIIEKE